MFLVSISHRRRDCSQNFVPWIRRRRYTWTQRLSRQWRGEGNNSVPKSRVGTKEGFQTPDATMLQRLFRFAKRHKCQGKPGGANPILIEKWLVGNKATTFVRKSFFDFSFRIRRPATLNFVFKLLELRGKRQLDCICLIINPFCVIAAVSYYFSLPPFLG